MARRGALAFDERTLGVETKREDYSQIPQKGPSINRKGGIRLHPIRDGLIPTTVDRTRLKYRDHGGNKFTEVTDPRTGFCVRVTSPLMVDSYPVQQSTPVVPTHNPARDSLPRRNANGTWCAGHGRKTRAIRTVELGDTALPSLTPVKPGANAKGGAVRPSNKPATTPNTTGERRQTRRLTMPQALVDAYIVGTAQRAAAKGNNKKGALPKGFTITPEMRKLARQAIAIQQDLQARKAQRAQKHGK